MTQRVAEELEAQREASIVELLRRLRVRLDVLQNGVDLLVAGEGLKAEGVIRILEGIARLETNQARLERALKAHGAHGVGAWAGLA